MLLIEPGIFDKDCQGGRNKPFYLSTSGQITVKVQFSISQKKTTEKCGDDSVQPRFSGAFGSICANLTGLHSPDGCKSAVEPKQNWDVEH